MIFTEIDNTSKTPRRINNSVRGKSKLVIEGDQLGAFEMGEDEFGGGRTQMGGNAAFVILNNEG